MCEAEASPCPPPLLLRTLPYPSPAHPQRTNRTASPQRTACSPLPPLILLPPLRPLVIGKRPGPKGDEYCIASEDCAFGPIGFTRVREVEPGEMVIITEDGRLLSRQVCGGG